MKNIGFIFVFIFSLHLPELKADNYVAAISSAAYSNYTVKAVGMVAFNPAGVGQIYNATGPTSHFCSGSPTCRYGPIIVYRYMYLDRTWTVMGMIDVNKSVVANYNKEGDGTYTPKHGYDLLAAALREKMGSVINFNATVTGNIDPPRAIYDIGICMGASIPDQGQTNRTYDMNSCSWIKPTISCNIQNSVVLDHGNLLLGSVNGNKKTNNVKVNCSGALSAKLFLLPDTINLAPGLVSKITVNGKSTEQTIPLRAGDNNITVESTLVDSGAKAGAFQGSTTLVVSFQ